MWLGGEPWDRAYRRSTKSKRLTLADYHLSNAFLLPYANTPFTQYAMYKPFVHCDWNKCGPLDPEDKWLSEESTNDLYLHSGCEKYASATEEVVYIPMQPKNIKMREKIDLNPLQLKM